MKAFNSAQGMPEGLGQVFLRKSVYFNGITMPAAMAVIISLFLAAPAFAETIFLKSGKTVEGKLVERTKDYVRIDVEGVPVTFFTEEIERVGDTAVSDTPKEAPPIKMVLPSEITNPLQEKKTEPQSASPGSYYSQKDGLFKVSVPEGWKVVDSAPDKILITTGTQEEGIVIMPKKEEGEVNEEAVKMALKFPVNLMGGTIIEEKKTVIGGETAWRLDFSVPKFGPDKPYSVIAVAAKGNLIMITFGGVEQAKRDTMEGIVRSLQF